MTQLEPFWKNSFVLAGSTRATFEQMGQKSLSDRLVFLHESCLYADSEFSLLTDYVRSAAQESRRFPILCLSSNYHPYDKIKKILNADVGNENYFILVADPKYAIDKNTAVWPEFLILINQLHNFQITKTKKYRISYISGMLRYHRLQLWQQIQPYITDQDVVRISQFGVENFENTFDHEKIPLLYAQDSLQKWLNQLPWSNHSELIDNQDQTLLNVGNPWDNSHLAYNAMVNITGETLADNDFMITEKTWKAYRSGCLVVNSGPTCVPAYLKKLGLEIWEEYDKCLPTLTKISLIKELFQRDDIADIYQSHVGMIQHNQNLVSNIDFIKSQTVDAVGKLQDLL